MLANADIASDRVTFVAADFQTDDRLAALVNTGFDLEVPTFVLWEGVSMYLNHKPVEATMRRLSTMARGSIVAFDYVTTEPLESGALYWRLARAATTRSGEAITFGVSSTPPSRERLSELLQACGLALVEQRTHGVESGANRAWGGFATATPFRRPALAS